MMSFFNVIVFFGFSQLICIDGLALPTGQGKVEKPILARKECLDRRQTLSTFLKGASLAFGLNIATPNESWAFPNKISDKYDDRPKRRGPQPKDLGVAQRKNFDGEGYIGLKNCGAAPNCFCSTDLDDPDHLLPSWQWPADLDLKSAFTQLEETINAYEPGQNNVDGGGFKVITSDLEKGYIYVQFEALKNGYIDDLEFAFIDAGAFEGKKNSVQLRSSSRVGYLDFGVNAKRINFIAKKMKTKGWVAEGVDPKTHEFYVMENSR